MSGSGNYSGSGDSGSDGGGGSGSNIDDDGVLTVVTVNMLAGAFLFLLFCLLRRSYRDFYHPRHRFRGTPAYAFTSASTKTTGASSSATVSPSHLTNWNPIASDSLSIASSSQQPQEPLQQSPVHVQQSPRQQPRRQHPPSSPFIPRQRGVDDLDDLIIEDDNNNGEEDEIRLSSSSFEASSSLPSSQPQPPPSSPRQAFVSYSSFAPTSPESISNDRASYTASTTSSYSSSLHHHQQQPTVYTSLLNQNRDEGLDELQTTRNNANEDPY